MIFCAPALYLLHVSVESRITSLTSIAIKPDLSLRSTAASTIQKPGNLMIRIGQPS